MPELEITHRVGDQVIEVDVDYEGYIDGGILNAEGSAYLERVIAKIEEAKAHAADRLLDIYNEGWTDEDHPHLNKQQFMDHLTLDGIYLLDTLDSAIIFFKDGDLFWGHLVTVDMEGETFDGADLFG